MGDWFPGPGASRANGRWLGTTATRALLVAPPDGRVLARAFRPLSASYLRPG